VVVWGKGMEPHEILKHPSWSQRRIDVASRCQNCLKGIMSSPGTVMGVRPHPDPNESS
jgi:hypothetical protein